MYRYKYPRPAVTVDIAIFMPAGEETRILLIQRGQEPYRGKYALPGGFMDIQETLEEAARRELLEETGVRAELTQVHTFSAPGRDPRGRVISTCFAALLPQTNQIQLSAGSDASQADWFDITDLPDLAFDHNQVLQIVIRKFLS